MYFKCVFRRANEYYWQYSFRLLVDPIFMMYVPESTAEQRGHEQSGHSGISQDLHYEIRDDLGNRHKHDVIYIYTCLSRTN